MKNETKAEKLLEALNDIPDDMIIAAQPSQTAKKRRLPLWVKISSAAAAVAVCAVSAGVLINLFSNGSVAPVDSACGTLKADENLPKITAEVKFGAMGFEGILTADISDYASANPWKQEQGIAVMPVYKNRVAKDIGSSVITDADYQTVVDELKSLLIDTAARLGVTVTEADITDNGYPEEDWEKIAQGYEAATRMPVPKGYFIPQRFKAVTEDYTITTDNDYVTTIEFTNPREVPVDMHSTEFDAVSQAAEYLKSEYSALIGMDEPTIAIDGGDYTYNGNKTWYEIAFYDAAGTVEQDIENYFMNFIKFYADDSGKLYLIRIFRYDLAGELVGNYPLLTVKQAAELLQNGEYASSVPLAKDYKPESYARAELVYRTGIRDEYYLPYYKFWVDITEELSAEGYVIEEGFKNYGAFYVPAVLPEYIEDIPTYDGSFNGGLGLPK